MTTDQGAFWKLWRATQKMGRRSSRWFDVNDELLRVNDASGGQLFGGSGILTLSMSARDHDVTL